MASSKAESAVLPLQDTDDDFNINELQWQLAVTQQPLTGLSFDKTIALLRSTAHDQRSLKMKHAKMCGCRAAATHVMMCRWTRHLARMDEGRECTDGDRILDPRVEPCTVQSCVNQPVG
jgi:hypothetical protein